MDKYLAVFTTFLFLTALIQCCSAAGGANPIEDPSSAYLTVIIANRLLYDITSGDGSTPDDRTVRRWIDQLNEALRCGLRYSQKVASVLVNRAVHIKRKIKNAGGRQRERFLSMNWTLVVPVDGVVPSTPSGPPIEDVTKLTHQVKALRSQLQAYQRVLQEIQQEETPKRRKRTAKHYSKRHERRLKKRRVEECAAALSWLQDDGLTPVSLTVLNTETNVLEKISIRKDLEVALNLNGGEELGEQEADLVSMMLYIKDRYNISGNAYHELASLCRAMPRHYRLKERIAQLNSNWNIVPTPEGTTGVQQSLQECLTLCIERLVTASPVDAPFLRDRKVRVKLTGDGTNIGKHLHVVNFAFTLLDEGDLAYSAAGNHCIAIFKETENYESMKLCLRDIIQDVETLNIISVCGIQFRITYFLGGDWKFLAMITGIDSATATHACIWCKCPAIDRYDSSQKWSITDTNFGARTTEENTALASSRTNKYNVSHPPLFPTIPLTRVVVDNLHMFLRVADTLIDLLILEFRRLDHIEKATKVKNIDQLHYIKKYESTLQMFGISGFAFWIGKESKHLKWRSLTGPEKLVVFQKINIAETFPEIPSAADVHALWKMLLDVNTLLSIRPEDITDRKISEFRSKSKEFVRLFTDIYPAKHVTPYMHCMMQHVGEFMTLSGALPFTQQGLEKYNDTMTKDYFRSSSHKGQECLTQILQKQNRIEHLQHSGATRKKRFEITCSICHCKGHNKLSCSKTITHHSCRH